MEEAASTVAVAVAVAVLDTLAVLVGTLALVVFVGCTVLLQ